MRTTILPALVAALFVPAAHAGVLDSVPVGGTVTVPGIAVAGKSTGSTLELKRIEVRAPGAQTIVMRADGTADVLPPDGRRWFISSDKGLAHRLALALEPDGKRFTGTLLAADGARRFEGTVRGDGLQVASSTQLATEPAPWSCGNQEHGIAGGPLDPAEPLASLALPKGTTIYEATVAVDSDTEFLSAKFGGNEVAATAYLEELFALINAFYERDLNVRLVRGTTILWDGPDPWSQSTTFNQLNEVGAYWKDNRAGVDRAFVAFLSGKSPSASSASGTAWVLTGGSYCAAKGTDQGGGQVAGHYSATQVFRFNGSTAASDVSIVAHEIGHNFGADHTHCTAMNGSAPASANTIDSCFNGEAPAGCYGGTPACPTDNSVSGRGSVMSYCHFSTQSGGAACGPVLQEFHPVHQGVLDARIATNVANSCFTATAGVPVDRIFYSGFE